MKQILRVINRRSKLNLVWFYLTILSVTVFLWYGWYTTKSFPKPVDIVNKSRRIAPSRLSTKPKIEATKHTTPPATAAAENVDTLYIGVSDLKAKSREVLEKNIKLSDELILKEPDLYWAYKSKLLNLLLLELKFQHPVDIDIYEGLYDELLSFRGLSEIEAIGTESVNAPELQEIDRDLIHIPFLRLAAIGDLQNLASAAEEYISEFPSSHIGYMYLAEAFWKQEDKASALSVFKKGFGESLSDEAAFDIISSFESKPAIERLAEMPLYQ